MITSTRNRATTGKLLALVVLLAALTASLMLVARPAHASTTFTVNSTGDKNDLDFPGGVFDGASDGKCFTGDILVVQGEECTLRAAIQEANAISGADTIEFDIPTTGVATISPATQLPTITSPVTVNGYSQPGARPNAKAVGNDALLKIELSGSGTGSGLVITGSNSTVKGLVINRAGAGIRIDGSAATGNKVVGNYLGTDANGTTDLGNDSYGVSIDGANNTIGGATAAERNVISGNDLLGVLVEDTSAGGHKVMGNYVGTDKHGTAPLGNSGDGVVIDDSPNNTVGGTTAATRNVISGNEGDGVDIYGAGGNKVQGNYVGTDASGTKYLGNSLHGVHVNGAPNNTVGGTESGARNVISGNGEEGVRVYGDGSTGNRILSNSIFNNAGLGIDLVGTEGPTLNDPGDKDTGPNNLQNKPVISSAKKGATGTTTVRGTLNSTPGKTFNVQFFSNPGGEDEGKTLLGSKSVMTNGTDNVSFTFSTKKAIRLGQNITATATGAYGTSEFSAPRKVVAQ